jgi:hypothetical protein
MYFFYGSSTLTMTHQSFRTRTDRLLVVVAFLVVLLSAFGTLRFAGAASVRFSSPGIRSAAYSGELE